MVEINLLKFFDKSFSEIDELLHGKQQRNETEEKEELTSVIKQKKKKSHALTYLILATLFIVISFSGYKFYELIKSNLVTVSNEGVKNSAKPGPPAQPKEAPKEENLIAEDTINGEDIVIGSIEFIDENITTASIDKALLDNNSEVSLQGNSKPKIEAKNEKPLKTEPIKTTYTLKLYYINDQTLDRIKKKLQSNPNKKLKILGKNSKTITKWFLYKPTKGTNQFIGSREVAFIKSFVSKNEAIEFAKRRNIPAIIVKKSEREISYDLTINNFSSRDEAFQFIKDFNINSKNIGIQES
jgi:hypothetical protein